MDRTLNRPSRSWLVPAVKRSAAETTIFTYVFQWMEWLLITFNLDNVSLTTTTLPLFPIATKYQAVRNSIVKQYGRLSNGESLASSAVKTSVDVDAKLILVLSETGKVANYGESLADCCYIALLCFISNVVFLLVPLQLQSFVLAAPSCVSRPTRRSHAN